MLPTLFIKVFFFFLPKSSHAALLPTLFIYFFIWIIIAYPFSERIPSNNLCKSLLVVQVIKARIHGLIEREYLERDASQANHYNYLA